MGTVGQFWHHNFIEKDHIRTFVSLKGLFGQCLVFMKIGGSMINGPDHYINKYCKMQLGAIIPFKCTSLQFFFLPKY